MNLWVLLSNPNPDPYCWLVIVLRLLLIVDLSLHSSFLMFIYITHLPLSFFIGYHHCQSVIACVIVLLVVSLLALFISNLYPCCLVIFGHGSRPVTSYPFTSLTWMRWSPSHGLPIPMSPSSQQLPTPGCIDRRKMLQPRVEAHLQLPLGAVEGVSHSNPRRCICNHKRPRIIAANNTDTLLIDVDPRPSTTKNNQWIYLI